MNHWLCFISVYQVISCRKIIAILSPYLLMDSMNYSLSHHKQVNEYIFFVQDRVSLCTFGCPSTSFVDHAKEHERFSPFDHSF